MGRTAEYPDAIVVGAGFAGAVCARELAQAGKRVLILEQRPQVGGNMMDGPDENGVNVHWYGPHIFHTNTLRVFHWLSRFTEWTPYEHRVLGNIHGQLVPIPFNFTSMEKLYPPQKTPTIQQKLREAFPGRDRVAVTELTEHGDHGIAELGNFVFMNVFAGYTAKQWGIPVEEVDISVLARVPVVLGYDDRYFQDRVQVMPKHGYIRLFEKILCHENISCRLNTPSKKLLRLSKPGVILFEEKPFSGPIVYTGAPDQLLHHRFGSLPYRSLDLRFERYGQTRFQDAAVINYPVSEEHTRITEFKYLTGQDIGGVTTILKEFPKAYDEHSAQEPYYPIETPKNRAMYEKYRAELGLWPNLHLCGRLAQYRYFNMDQVVEQALTTSESILHNVGSPTGRRTPQ